MLKTTLLASALLVAIPGMAAAQDADPLAEAVAADYDANLEELFLWFHQNPELSFGEKKTAKRLAREIRKLGYKVTENVGGTGVVAVMENGEGPVVLVRADMDGLPVKEDTGLSYASTAMQVDRDGVEKPVMHACGHDVHVTSLVGTARQMAEHKDEWSGTLILIGQPAEERISGAREMLEDGLYERFPKPDYALAFHVSSEVPTGKLVVKGGPVYSSSDSVDIYVKGVGAHGASPHRGVDPILVASTIVVNLQTLVSRTISPLDSGVVTVGAFHGGIKHNIIPAEAHLQLTVRSDKPEVRAALLDGIDRVAEGTARALGVPEDLLPVVERSPTETTPPTENDMALATEVRATFDEHFGDSIFYDSPRTGMGAEDFAYFVAPEYDVKGVYFAVGGTPEDEVANAPSHHSPFFKIAPRESVTLGTEAMTVAAMSLMQKAGE
ncbi:amidohydrolase [Parvularcula marina]|uniref:Amidohydrolase n=1 Tax=Parvularcula marina TaxID=2292771 RepID=A0A371RJI4_9PROT|nr:amidohydrolase [Parvularcula marina]RFB05612.1 amidohydrolase [Parvularcula marina]